MHCICILRRGEIYKHHRSELGYGREQQLAGRKKKRVGYTLKNRNGGKFKNIVLDFKMQIKQNIHPS